MKHLKTYESNEKDIAFSVGDIVKNIDDTLNNELFKVIKIYNLRNDKNVHFKYMPKSQLDSYDFFLDIISINNKNTIGIYARRFIKASNHETTNWELYYNINKYNI
jgi:hypothetical protein